MLDQINPALAQATDHAYSIPLDQVGDGWPERFRADTFWPYFDRLRKEDPVHYCKESEFGPYWSVTKYNDIMAVDTNHGIFSSDSKLGGIVIRDAPADQQLPASSRWMSQCTVNSAGPSSQSWRHLI